MVSIVGVNLALCLFFIQLETVTSSGFKCGDDGFYANPNQCRKFIACSNGKRMDFSCPKGTSWHEDKGMCDDTDMSKCATKTTPAPARKVRSADISDEDLNERLMAMLKDYKPCQELTTANPTGSTSGDSSEGGDSSDGTTRPAGSPDGSTTEGGEDDDGDSSSPRPHPDSTPKPTPSGGSSEEGDSSGGTTRGHRLSTKKPTTSSSGGSSEEGNSSDSTPRPSGTPQSTTSSGGSSEEGDSSDSTRRTPNPTASPGDPTTEEPQDDDNGNSSETTPNPHGTPKPTGSPDGNSTPSGGDGSEEGDSSSTTRPRGSTGGPDGNSTPSGGDGSEEGDSSDSTTRGSSTQKPSGSTDGGDSGEDHHPPRNYTTRSPDNSGSSTTDGPSPSTLPPPTCPACPIPTEKTCPPSPICDACPNQQANQTCPPAAACPTAAPLSCPVCPTVGACPKTTPAPKCPTCPAPAPEKTCPTVPACPSQPTQAPKTACPAGWKQFNGNCYSVGNATVNGTDAQRACRSQGGDLASIHSKDENAFIIDYVNSTAPALLSSGAGLFWIGSYRTGPNVTDFRNYDGTTMDYSNWRPVPTQQPDNYQLSQYCNSMITYNAKYWSMWDDDNCPSMHTYICKQPVNK